MPVIPAIETLQPELSAVKLARYTQLIGYDERPFFGIKPASSSARHACGDIWTKQQRDVLQRYLWEAQYEIEQQVMFPLEARWIANDDFYNDSQHFNLTMRTRFHYVQEIGIMATADISLNEPVDHTNDPAVIGPVIIPAGTTAYEIRVFHPGTDVEIPASQILITGGGATIAIPRARLIGYDYADNPAVGYDYGDTGVGGPFEQAVDVKRIYNSTTTQAILSRPQNCGNCAETIGNACIRILDKTNGYIHVIPDSVPCRCHWGKVSLYYRAGPWYISAQAEDTVIRLAHAKMPEEPCGCDAAQNLWKRDRAIPEGFMPDERMRSPWGVADGAWIAWQFTKTMIMPRGVTL